MTTTNISNCRTVISELRQPLSRITDGFYLVLDEAKHLREKNAGTTVKIDTLLKSVIETEYKHLEEVQTKNKEITLLTDRHEQMQKRMTGLKLELKENETRQKLTCQLQENQISALYSQLKEVNLKNCSMEQTIKDLNMKSVTKERATSKTAEFVETLTTQREELNADLKEIQTSLADMKEFASKIKVQLGSTEKQLSIKNEKIKELQRDKANMEQSLLQRHVGEDTAPEVTQKARPAEDKWADLVKQLHSEIADQKAQINRVTGLLARTHKELDAQVALNAERLKLITELKADVQAAVANKPEAVAQQTSSRATSIFDDKPRSCSQEARCSPSAQASDEHESYSRVDADSNEATTTELHYIPENHSDTTVTTIDSSLCAASLSSSHNSMVAKTVAIENSSHNENVQTDCLPISAVSEPAQMVGDILTRTTQSPTTYASSTNCEIVGADHLTPLMGNAHTSPTTKVIQSKQTSLSDINTPQKSVPASNDDSSYCKPPSTTPVNVTPQRFENPYSSPLLSGGSRSQVHSRTWVPNTRDSVGILAIPDSLLETGVETDLLNKRVKLSPSMVVA
eukprot:CFRG3837T1